MKYLIGYVRAHLRTLSPPPDLVAARSLPPAPFRFIITLVAMPFCAGKNSTPPGLAYTLREFSYCHSTPLLPPLPHLTKIAGWIRRDSGGPRRRREPQPWTSPAHAWPAPVGPFDPSVHQDQEPWTWADGCVLPPGCASVRATTPKLPFWNFFFSYTLLDHVCAVLSPSCIPYFDFGFTFLSRHDLSAAPDFHPLRPIPKTPEYFLLFFRFHSGSLCRFLPRSTF